MLSKFLEMDLLCEFATRPGENAMRAVFCVSIYYSGATCDRYRQRDRLKNSLFPPDRRISAIRGEPGGDGDTDLHQIA